MFAQLQQLLGLPAKFQKGLKKVSRVDGMVLNLGSGRNSCPADPWSGQVEEGAAQGSVCPGKEGMEGQEKPFQIQICVPDCLGKPGIGERLVWGLFPGKASRPWLSEAVLESQELFSS